MKRLLALLAILALASCAGTKAQTVASSQTPLEQLAQFTVADLQAALADANSAQDVAASQCYSYLIKVIPTIQARQSQGTVGAFLAFQKARDLTHGINNANGQLVQLNIACAPLVVDSVTTINKLAVLGVGGTATGGVLSPLLPALNAAIVPLAP